MQKLPRVPHMGQAPLIGQQQQQAQMAIRQAMQEMSVGIYSGLATAHIASRDKHQEVDCAHLQRVAADSLAAARAYFVGVGVISAESES